MLVVQLLQSGTGMVCLLCIAVRSGQTSGMNKPVSRYLVFSNLFGVFNHS